MVEVRRAGSLLRIQVNNPVDKQQLSPRGNGVGLDNVRQRLLGAYGHEASVHWSRQNGGFEVSISMPAQTGSTQEE